jgi:hypothetical protein
MGMSTRRACAATLWLASVEVTTASTYDFHATHSKKQLRIPTMSISHFKHVHLHVFQDGSGSQGGGQGYDFVDSLFNPTGRIWRQRRGAIVVVSFVVN